MLRRKRIVQYHIYNNQYNLSKNQISHAEQMHLVTVIQSTLIFLSFNISLLLSSFFSPLKLCILNPILATFTVTQIFRNYPLKPCWSLNIKSKNEWIEWIKSIAYLGRTHGETNTTYYKGSLRYNIICKGFACTNTFYLNIMVSQTITKFWVQLSQDESNYGKSYPNSSYFYN